MASRGIACIVLAVALLSATSSPAQNGTRTPWQTIHNEDELVRYGYTNFSSEGRRFYPISVDCRKRRGELQVRFTVLPAGPDKPYHKWNVTLQRQGESQADAAARLPIKGHEDVKYRIKFGCKAAGKTVLVAFRGTRNLD